MDPKADNDVMASMISTLSDLESSKQELQAQNQKLKKVIEDLLGYDMNSKKCPKNHPLCYVASQKGFMKYFWCDKCKERCDKFSTVRWTCKQCNFDSCVKCEGFRKNLCPFMHVLHAKVIPQNQSANRVCDTCLVNIYGTYYSCGCNFDMCEKCKQYSK